MIAISLQIFWQKFFRNVYLVALYFKIYNVCLSPPISLVVMATKMLNLRKIFKNQLLRSNKGDKAETFAEMLISIAFSKMLSLFMFFRCYGNLSFHRLIMENMRTSLIAVSFQVFWQNFLRQVCWVVLHQAEKYCKKSSCWFVAMATESLKCWTKLL